jgi:CheY-like chemotaxis protein
MSTTLAAPIMLIDDDDDLRICIGEVLEESGFEVVCFASAEDALTQLESGVRPSLILLDLMMPGMTGYGFREEQRRAPELAKLPVVLITAHPHHEPSPLLDGLIVLQKPFSAELLLRTVDGEIHPRSR